MELCIAWSTSFASVRMGSDDEKGMELKKIWSEIQGTLYASDFDLSTPSFSELPLERDEMHNENGMKHP